MINVIVVEDSDEFREEIVFSLTQSGAQVSTAGDSAGLYRLLLQAPADIIVLDYGLPTEDGLSILRQLRSLNRTRYIGIILITGSRTSGLHHDSLESGADIYLQKPFSLDVLCMYVMNLYRRLCSKPEVVDEHGWLFRACESTLYSPSGTAIKLTYMESLLIQIIAHDAGKPVKRRDIIVKAFGKNPMTYDARSLDAIVSRLRKKIHRSYPLSQPIQVAHSFGYMFVAPIKCA